MMPFVRPSAAGKLARLLFCAQTRVDSDASKRILALATSEPDWDALLAARLFRAPLPHDVADCLKRDAGACSLIDGICQRFLSPEQAQAGVLSRFAFRVRMRGSFAAGMPYAVRLALMPTEFDRGRHGRFLEPLYALRRPLRLARIYGWRTHTGS